MKAAVNAVFVLYDWMYQCQQSSRWNNEPSYVAFKTAFLRTNPCRKSKNSETLNESINLKSVHFVDSCRIIISHYMVQKT
jgi:hypothetical protein